LVLGGREIGERGPESMENRPRTVGRSYERVWKQVRPERSEKLPFIWAGSGSCEVWMVDRGPGRLARFNSHYYAWHLVRRYLWRFGYCKYRWIYAIYLEIKTNHINLVLI
jgi:hypothetical protein